MERLGERSAAAAVVVAKARELDALRDDAQVRVVGGEPSPVVSSE